mgnify:CR=1 FL=1
MANMIARLGVLLGLDSAEFNKGIEASSKKLDSFVQGANRAATVAAAAFTAMAAKAIMFADEVADIAAANDLAIDSVIKLQNALISTGGSAENAQKLLSSFTNSVDKAAQGSFEAQKNFALVGVSLRDLGNLSMNDLLIKTAQGLSQIDDGLTRNARAMDFFGKAAKGIDFTEFVKGLQTTSENVDKQAASIKTLAEYHDKLQLASRNTTLIFATLLGPAIDRINEAFAKADQLAASKKGFLGGFFDLLNSQWLDARISAVREEIGRLQEELKIPNLYPGERTRVEAELERQRQLLRELTAEATEAKSKLDPLFRKDDGAGGGRGFITPPLAGSKKPSDGGPKRQVTEAINPELVQMMRMWARAHGLQLQAIEELSQEEIAYGRIVSRMVDFQAAQKRRLDTDQKLVTLQAQKNAMYEYEYQYQTQIIELEHQHAEALRELDNAGLLPEEREASKAREVELYKQQLGLLKQIRDIEAAKREGTIEEGIFRRFREFMKDLPTEVERGAMMFDSVFGNMESALTNFVRNGKLSFKDLTRSIIQDLLLIQMRAQMSGLFKMMGMFFGGNPIGASGYSDMGTFTSLMAAGGLANGGPIGANEMHLVGERGPELFVPKSAGTVIPNERLNSLGGATTVNNYNIQAIDVKSFEERIFGSANAVWAASAYAQKRLPLGAGRM